MMLFRRKKRGFSLVELMIVVAIIGILIAVLLPELGDMATRARISSAQRSMNAMRDAIIRYQTQEGRKLKQLSWLVPKYMSEIKRDPWGNPYAIIPGDGVIISAGPDGEMNLNSPADPRNRDNIVISYLPPLSISDAQITVDINGNSLIDNGDVITIYFSKPPAQPANANSAGNDFVFMNQYQHDGSDSEIPHTNASAIDNSNIGTLATISPDGSAPNGRLNGEWSFVNLRITRDPGQNSSFSADIFVRFDDFGAIDGSLGGNTGVGQGGCLDPTNNTTTYRDKRSNVARNHNDYNVRVKRPGEM